MLGYELKEKLFESNNSLVYRGSSKNGRGKVIIKILKGEFPSYDRIIRFRREYELLNSLKLDGVIQTYALEEYNNSLAMIMEDLGAESLDQILRKRKLSLGEFLELSVRISHILGEIHHENIIHKNINPSNIIWNAETNQIKFIDFGISTILPRETTAVFNPNVLEGTLAYISPEQTGRMNRMMDYHTDLYSLGISFYEIITGRLPFESTDPLEMVHFHIAKEPVPPHQVKTSRLNGSVPEVLSRIILKLMAKIAEDRYQSAYGLKNDLEESLMQFRHKGRVESFPIAQHDISDKFLIPQKLYGREKEIETLVESFHRVNDVKPDPLREQPACEMVVVTGYAGIGKSALINEVQKAIVEKRGYLISGKFEQFKQNTPYSALIQAFSQLIRQILTEPEQQIMEWKERILESVGPNGQVIIDVIPEIEMLIGKQPALPILGPIESQNRFNFYFHDFIRAFASREHPLTIILDDLQWADLPSLKLIEILMLDVKAKYMLIIGAYRDKEVDEFHSLSMTLNEIRKRGAGINRINLQPLDKKNVNQLVSDTVNRPLEETEELAKLCLAKTNGNPFFLRHFLKTLYDERCLEFDSRKISWCWTISEIEKVGITDNVVDLMENKIHKLPERTQDVLKLAACIGNLFDLRTLSIVNEKSIRETAEELWDSLREEMILPLSDSYKYVDILKAADSDKFESLVERTEYKFSHDRIQQATYSMINEDRKKYLNYKIGRLLLASSSDPGQDEKLFSIVNHLNSAIDLITEPREREELIDLNLLAGKKAKLSAAYKPALDYLQFGMGLLPLDSWESQYERTLEFHDEAVVAAYLNGEFETMDELAASVVENAWTSLDQVNVYAIKIQSYQAQYKLKEAVHTAIDIINQLGVHFPYRPTVLNILFDLLRVRKSLIGKTVDDLENLPRMTDPNKLAVLQICRNSGTAIYLSNRKMVPLIALRVVHLSIKFGNSPNSTFAYVSYGLILCGLLGDPELGYRFGKLALKLTSRFQSNEQVAMVYLMFNCFVRHWKDHLRETLVPLTEGVQWGLETGDFEYSGHCARVYCFHLICWTSKDLSFIDQEMAKYLEISRKTKQEPVIIAISQFRQFVLKLINADEDHSTLTGSCFDEEEMTPIMYKANDLILLNNLYMLKTILGLLFGHQDMMMENARNAEKSQAVNLGLFSSATTRFYNSLAMLSVFSSASALERRVFLRKVRTTQRKMKRWAKHAPENYQNKWALVEAEKERVLGNELTAMSLYEQAIEKAKENGYMLEEALANELAAKYHYARNNMNIARTYMNNARFIYEKFGAKAKVKNLDDHYPDLLFKAPEKKPGEKEPAYGAIKSFFGSSVEKLDLATVQKASFIISGEIHLEKLLDKMMRIIVTNAGAQKGTILLKEKRKLFVEAEIFTDQDRVDVLQHIPFEECSSIPEAIINYVLRTEESVVIDDGSKPGKFANDDYIRQNQPKSIFCMPLIYKDKLSGVLYLENKLSTASFTAERVEVLRMLTGQMVMSIENARLYKNLEESNITLEEKVRERTMELEKKNLTITDSLYYARNIQNALLPVKEDLDRLLPANFFINRPKEIVSGDYLWMVTRESKIIIAVADCTGHGVPGAFMSILGIALLNEIVNKADILRTDQILNQLRSQVIKSLHQTGTEIEAKDGIEIALCILDFETGKLQYSGAFQSLYLIRNGKLTEYKGDNLPIGIYDDPGLSFSQTEIDAREGDVVYMFTDGYLDQLGGPGRKTFRSRHFKELLLKIHRLSMEEQRRALEAKHEEWKGGNEQIDDIMILGFNITNLKNASKK